MLKILGDICFADGYFDTGIGIGSAIKNGTNPFVHLNRKPEDLWIGNFECVCSSEACQGTPFVVTPDILKCISHLDVYGIANNHVMQYGDEGYVELLKYLDENKIAYAGSNERRSAIFRHQGKKIGMIAFSLRPDNFTDKPLYWHLPELADISFELQKLDSCDFKIAFVHWGYEFINYPNLEQKQLGHWLIDSGVDIVVGMHPHIAQGCEIYKEKHIFYSLGNAVFNMPWIPTKYGLLLNIDLSTPQPDISTEYIHIGEDFFPSVVKNVPECFSLSYLNSLLSRTEENEKYFANAKNYYLQYRHANRLNIIRNLLKINHSGRMEILKSFIQRRIK